MSYENFNIFFCWLEAVITPVESTLIHFTSTGRNFYVGKNTRSTKKMAVGDDTKQR